MATIVDSLPDVILAIMGLLGLIRVRRCSNAFAAAASLFGVEEAELYRQVELFIVDRWEELFAALDVYGRGRQYFVGEAAGHRPNPLLLEAACRLMKAQLTILDLDRHSGDLFGHDGRMYTAVIQGGQFIALMGQPLVPWHEDVFREIEPSTSSWGRVSPRIVLPMQAVPEEVVLLPEAGPRLEEANMTLLTPPELGMEDIFDTGFLDELPSTPRLRCTAFQSSPDSTSERDVRHLLSSNAQRSPLMTAPSRRITRRRSSSESHDINKLGIMGLCVMPVTLGDWLDDAGDGHSAESPVGRSRRKRVVRRISLQSTPDASPDRSAEEVSALPLTPPAQPQRCRRSDWHNGAWTGQDGSDHRGSVALGEESAVIADLTNTPSVGVEHLQSIAPGYSTAQTVRVAESQLSRSTSGRLPISMSGIAALNMRGRALLSDDKESHNVHTGRPATAQATDTCVGRNANIRRAQYALNEDSRTTARNANSPRRVAVDALAGVSSRRSPLSIGCSSVNH